MRASKEWIPLDVSETPSGPGSPDIPFVWRVRDVLSMTGTNFGCGTSGCGACTIHVDGQPTRSCITPVLAGAGKRIITIELVRPRQGLATDLRRLAMCAPPQR